MTKTHATEPASAALDACPACHAPWTPGASLIVHSVDAGDTMLASGALSAVAGGLHYTRCGSCRSLIAVDARRQPGVLDDIYRELPDSYWKHLNPQDRFAHSSRSM